MRADSFPTAFTQRHARKLNKPITRIGRKTMTALCHHPCKELVRYAVEYHFDFLTGTRLALWQAAAGGSG